MATPLLFLLNRSIERLEFLKNMEPVGFLMKKKAMRVADTRIASLQKLVNLLPAILTRQATLNCPDRVLDTRDFLAKDLPTLCLRSRKSYLAFSEQMDTWTNETPVAEILHIARTALLSSLYPTVGDRYVVKRILDPDTPVISAIDSQTQSKVAIKVLGRGEAGIHEIAVTRLAASLDRNSIQPLAIETTTPEPGSTKVHLAMVLEFCDSDLFHLRQDIRPGTLMPLEMFRATFRPVVRILAALHEAGYAHGDLKPDNIMYSRGQVRLIDYGLAACIGSEVSRKNMYTIGFVPPEFVYVARGLRRVTVTPAMDVFALGMTMLLALVPDMPEVFSANSKPVYIRGREKLNVALARLQGIGGQTGLVATLIEQMVSYEPATRPTMADVLEQLMEGPLAVEQLGETTCCTRCFETACATFDTPPSVMVRVSRVMAVDGCAVDLVQHLGPFSARSVANQYLSLVENSELCGGDPIVPDSLDMVDI